VAVGVIDAEPLDEPRSPASTPSATVSCPSPWAIATIASACAPRTATR